MGHIHLIYPDVNTGYYQNINHGLAFLAGALTSNGHEVSFHHVNSSQPPDEVAAKALKNEPDVIGFSLCHNQAHLAKEYIQAIRKKGTKAFLIAGGIFPTTDPENAFIQLDVDAIAIGEAEHNIAPFMDEICSGRETKKQIPSFYYRKTDGQIIKTDIPPLNQDLSKLPLPNYSIFNINKIVDDSGGWMTMMLLRGCPFNCNYCCNSILMNLYPVRKNYFRFPPIDHAIKLIKHNLSQANNVTGIAFDDDLLCHKKDWFMSFSESYRQNIGLPYTMNARVETLTDEIIDAMKRSGCRIVNIGVESGNAWVRKNLLNRHYSNERLIDVFSKLRASGILPSSFNMMGLPFETKDQMIDTLRVNKKLRPYRGSCFYFYPYPKTKLYDICKEFNLLEKDTDELKGYFTSPAIKLTHCNLKDANRTCNRLRLFLHLSRILSHAHLGFATPLLYYLMLPFAGIISRGVAGNSKLKSMIRSLVYRSVPMSENTEN